jgi:hypothetical protein
MEELLESARAYLAGLEAERRAALALSEQKAEEAKLIKARQEGFQAAMEILCGEAPGDNFGSDRPRASAAGLRSDPEEPRRRGRRPIPQLILRELSFSGQAMTTAQLAKAVEYLPDRTGKALERMEKAGQVRNEEGRWAITLSAVPQMNVHADGAGNGKIPASPDDAI